MIYMLYVRSSLCAAPGAIMSILSVDGFVANAIAIEAQQWNVVQISMSAYLNRMWRALDHLDNLSQDLLP